MYDVMEVAGAQRDVRRDGALLPNIADAGSVAETRQCRRFAAPPSYAGNDFDGLNIIKGYRRAANMSLCDADAGLREAIWKTSNVPERMLMMTKRRSRMRLPGVVMVADHNDAVKRRPKGDKSRPPPRSSNDGG